MRIIIERIAEDKLSKKEYTFFLTSKHYDSLKLTLDKYLELSKLTTRKHLKIDKRWNRLDGRSNDFKDEEILSMLTPEIIQEAKERLKEEIDKLEISI